jgi:hypothetical protein
MRVLLFVPLTNLFLLFHFWSSTLPIFTYHEVRCPLHLCPDRPLSCIGDLHRGSRWTTYVRPVRRSELPGLDRLRRPGRVRRAEHMVSSFFSRDLSAPNWHFHLRFSQCLQATASSGVTAPPVTSAPSADPAPPPAQSSVGSAPSSTSSTSTAIGSPGATSFLIGVNIAYVILFQFSPITQLH